jgi:hypothetical protein
MVTGAHLYKQRKRSGRRDTQRVTVCISGDKDWARQGGRPSLLSQHTSALLEIFFFKCKVGEFIEIGKCKAGD